MRHLFSRKPYDPNLWKCLQARNVEEARPHLERLLQERANKIMLGILRRKTGALPGLWRSNAERQAMEVDDLLLDAQHDVTRWIYSMRGIRPPEEIHAQFDNYVATIAFNVFHEALRKLYPHHQTLKERLQSIIERSSKMALWQRGRFTVCGIVAWKNDAARPLQSLRLQALRQNPEPFLTSGLGGKQPDEMEMEDLLMALCGWVRHPLTLNVATNCVAAILGIGDRWETVSLSKGEGEDETALDIADPAPSVETQVEDRIGAGCERIWQAMGRLKARHAAVILLKAETPQGSMLALLCETGLATEEDLARVMGLPLETLRQFWDDIPLDDKEIARILGVPPKQILFLRHDARAYLKRDLAQPDDQK